MLLAAQLDSRTDLTALDRALPELAGAFRQVRDELNRPTPGPTEARARVGPARRAAGRDPPRPAFRRFLLPPRLADLRAAAGDGTVVMVNSGRRRGDAVLVRADADPVAVPCRTSPTATYGPTATRCWRPSMPRTSSPGPSGATC
ncbi:hypothetical protein NKH77_18535 [Streptomyces sp. M19]